MLRGKRAVITGGGSGFGQALAVWLAREGVSVDYCARRPADIQEIRQQAWSERVYPDALAPAGG